MSSKFNNKYVIFLADSEDSLMLGKLIYFTHNFGNFYIIYENEYTVGNSDIDEINEEKMISLYDIVTVDVFETFELEDAKYNYKKFVNDLYISYNAEKYNL